MKVFLSWSGDRSLAIAKALHEWMPNALQAVRPWMSKVDIDKGVQWSQQISAELQEARVGVMCLTPENLHAEWLHFEAGALSKALDRSFVCTYLYDVQPTDLEWPLAMFQATRADKEETKSLLHTINRALGENRLPDERLALGLPPGLRQSVKTLFAVR
jgi:hypothetical protein